MLSETADSMGHEPIWQFGGIFDGLNQQSQARVSHEARRFHHKLSHKLVIDLAEVPVTQLCLREQRIDDTVVMGKMIFFVFIPKDCGVEVKEHEPSRLFCLQSTEVLPQSHEMVI